MGAPDRDIAQAKDFTAPPGYRRHRPEATLLYRLVAEHYAGFRDRRAAEGRPLPRYVEDEFEAYLKCGLLEHGFLRLKCDSCQAEKLVAFSCKRRGFCPSCGAVATERLSLTQGGNVRYALKTPYRDGTTHVIFEPEDFIARLVALVPKPRAHLTRYHGAFAPASPDRAQVVPRTGAAASTERAEVTEGAEESVSDRQRAMSWAQRLRRVFAIDIETCRQCGGHLRVIASIEAPAVIERILEHLGGAAESVDPAHPSRAPPKGDRLV